MDENLNEMNVTENVEPQNVAPVEPVIQNVTNAETVESNVGMGNDNGGKKKDPAAVGFVILIIALFALLVAGGFLIVNSLKNDGEIIEALKDDYMFGMHNEMADLMKKDGKHTIKYKIDLLSLLSALNYDDVKFENISFENTLVQKAGDASGRFSFLYGDESLVDFDYAKTGDLYGAKVPGLFEKFIAIENNNLKALAEKYDIPSDEIPDKITEEEILNMVNTVNTEDIEKYEKIGERYLKVLFNNLKDNTVTTKNEMITINGKEMKTVKHSAGYSEKEAAQIILDVFKEAYNDKELYELISAEDESLKDVTFEKYQELLSGEIARAEDAVKDMGEEEIYEFSVYVKGSDTVAIEFKETKSNIIVRVAGITESKKSYLEVSAEAPKQNMIIKFVLNTTKDGSSYKSNLGLTMNVSEAATFDFNLMEYEYTYEKSSKDEVLVINSDNSLILNTATEDDLNAWAKEVANNAESYLNAITAKVPEEVVEAITAIIVDTPTSIIEDAYKDDYDYDDSYDWEDDYDYNYDDEYDYDWDSNYSTDFESKVKILPELQSMYKKIELGMSKEELINKLGEPDSMDKVGSLENASWGSSIDEYYNVSVYFENGVVSSKYLNVSSSSWDGIALSKELGTTQDDLSTSIKYVAKGMTLSEVKAVLGNECIETCTTKFGDTTYTWYDTKEQNVEIDFDKNQKVDYIGIVWGSY